jgi:hypothetical protein
MTFEEVVRAAAREEPVEDCEEWEAEIGLYDRWVLCAGCRERMVAACPPVRQLTDEELIRAVLNGPGIRRPQRA